jgi:hypothetical protein
MMVLLFLGAFFRGTLVFRQISYTIRRNPAQPVTYDFYLFACCLYKEIYKIQSVTYARFSPVSRSRTIFADATRRLVFGTKLLPLLNKVGKAGSNLCQTVASRDQGGQAQQSILVSQFIL